MINLDKKPSMIFSKQLVQINAIHIIRNDLSSSSARHLEYKETILKQAYIVYLVAAWQSYVVNLVKFGFKELGRSDTNSMFRTIVENRMNRALEKFSTPDQDNIDKLFFETLNVEKISNSWNLEECDRNTAIKELKNILKIRHQIAHTARTKTQLSIESNYAKMEFLYKLSLAMEKFLLEWLAESKTMGSK